jgi:hypothetical protein
MISYIVLLALFISSVHCEVYVDAHATCGGVCSGSSDAPFLTINEGLNAVANGGQIVIRDGVYKGIGNKNLNVTRSNTFIVSVNGPERTIIDCENHGFGFDLFSGTFSIEGLTVRNCYRNYEQTYQDQSYGGGAFSIHNTFTTLTNMIIVDNDAMGLGGAVYINSNTVFMYNTTITGNEVSGIGGGVYVQSAYLKLDNHTTLQSNKASVNASDLFCISATVELIDKDSTVDKMECPKCSVVRDHKNICSGTSIVTTNLLLVIAIILVLLMCDLTC